MHSPRFKRTQIVTHFPSIRLIAFAVRRFTDRPRGVGRLGGYLAERSNGGYLVPRQVEHRLAGKDSPPCGPAEPLCLGEVVGAVVMDVHVEEVDDLVGRLVAPADHDAVVGGVNGDGDAMQLAEFIVKGAPGVLMDQAAILSKAAVRSLAMSAASRFSMRCLGM